jgi:serine-type D-Ala-D-Ala carboxypeptidase (penicillin-binding protein 5/6)
MNFKRAIGGFLLSFVFLIIFLYAASAAKWIFKKSLPIEHAKASFSQAVENAAPKNDMTLAVLNINSSAAISVESNLVAAGKIIFQKNSDLKLPIASLTKLMTAVVALDNYDLSKKITVSKEADLQAPMKLDVKFGDTMSGENFLEIMLIESSNKSAYALSEVMGEPEFVTLMNKKAQDLGLENTFFTDPTGLSTEDVSTAEDLAKLAEYILKNYPKIAEISKKTSLFIPGFGVVENSDQLLGEVPEAVCSKTGFTTQAKGCLLLVVDNQKNNDYIINVILGATDRFLEMKKLIDTCK